MFLKSSGLVFLAISLCVQASPAPDPCDEVSTTSPTASVSATNHAASPSTTGEQASFTLDSKVVCSGFAQNGQETPTPGQVPSLTSTNNFINFCANFPNVNLTNGEQLVNGSCNPAPMGSIPSTNNMPSSKFQSPINFSTLKANHTFIIKLAIVNMETGHFVNSDTNYYAAPQQLNSKGQIIGHSHFVVQKISSFTDTTVLDPTKFVSFSAVNTAAVNGVLSVSVDGGLAPGCYRLSSINTAANHQPALVPIAKRGSLDDMIYFSVTANGSASSNSINIEAPAWKSADLEGES